MEEAEGDYTAALRGSNSKHWQAMHPADPPRSNYSAATGFEGPNLLQGACYRCKKEGHWAKDCPMFPAGSSAPMSENPAQQKACPCGAGMCVVRTSNTSKNPGRQFFACPKPQDASCKFFEWCDAAATTGPVVSSNFSGSQQPTEAEFKCPGCGQSCSVFVSKTEKNPGRKFYKCAKDGCKTFKWCDELASAPGFNSSAGVGGGSFTGTGGSFSAGYGNPPAAYGGSPGYAKSAPGYGNSASGYGTGYGNSYGGYGSPQGKIHQIEAAQPPWIQPTNSSMPNRPGSCYKCGEAGHYANSCPVRQ